jgi:hypothetical protein
MAKSPFLIAAPKKIYYFIQRNHQEIFYSHGG